MKKEISKIIALYGGAFDPPHKGHIQLIKNLRQINFVNQIWLLPCGDRDDKKLLFTANERFQLVNKLSQRLKNQSTLIKVSDQEINLSKQLKRMIPTIQLLEYLDKKFPHFQFHFVVGSDILETLNTWQKYEKLLKEHKFIIFPRKGYEINVTQNKGQNNENKISKEEDSAKNNVKKLYLPEHYYVSSFIPPEISSSFLKKTLLDEKLSKKQKQEIVRQFLDDLTLDLLKKKNYI